MTFLTRSSAAAFDAGGKYFATYCWPIASPIARAMISKEVGDVVEVNTPGGVKAYEIPKVEWK